MESSNFIDLYSGESLAEKYLKYRPSYPKHIAETIIDQLKKSGARQSENGKFSRMLDVGCGSGQATFGFSPYFDSILALDISADQIKMGKKDNKCDNVSFQQMFDKYLPVEDESVDFMNCASAAHLFDIKYFTEECQRVLKPNGCVAIYFRSIKSIMTIPVKPAPNQEELNLKLHGLNFQFLRSVGMHPSMEICERKYVPIFEQIPASSKVWLPGLEFFVEWTLKEYRHFRTTNGEYHKFMETNPPNDPLNEAMNNIKQLLNVEGQSEEQIKTRVTWDVPTIIFKKE
ncbi:uncharacterized protein LOC120329881 [Styela clava]